MSFNSFRDFIDRYMMSIALGVMVFGLVFVYFAPNIMVTIPAGHEGVMWYRFHHGTDVEHSVPEGTHFKFPWNELYLYDARMQVVTRDFDVITKDGLAIKTTISFRFRINTRWLGLLHKNVGVNYVDVMLYPEIGSTARVLISQYTSEEFYTTYRMKVQNEILSQIRDRMVKENIYSAANIVLIEIDEVMIKEISLPERVSAAIERKIEQYQQQLEYDFRLQSETKEALRKEIEGKGVRAMFDGIGTKDLNNYLRLAGINATLQLAASNNAKVVIVGGGGSGGTGGLPLILGSDITATPPQIGGQASTDVPLSGPLGPLASHVMSLPAINAHPKPAVESDDKASKKGKADQ